MAEPRELRRGAGQRLREVLGVRTRARFASVGRFCSAHSDLMRKFREDLCLKESLDVLGGGRLENHFHSSGEPRLVVQGWDLW